MWVYYDLHLSILNRYNVMFKMFTIDYYIILSFYIIIEIYHNVWNVLQIT